MTQRCIFHARFDRDDKGAGNKKREDTFLLNLNVHLAIPFYSHLELNFQEIVFSTFTASASVSWFTNTVIGVPLRVRNASAILTTGTLAWLKLGRQKNIHQNTMDFMIEICSNLFTFVSLDTKKKCFTRNNIWRKSVKESFLKKNISLYNY